MSAHLFQAKGEPAALNADTHFYRSVLLEMIDIGAEFARLALAQAKAEPSALAEANIAFDRTARCVRRCVALARTLGDPAPAPNPVQDCIAARKRIIRDVEDAIQREVPAANNEAACAELRDRLDAPDLDDDIDGRPIDEIIADIRHDLGLGAPRGAHPWKRRTPEDIAELFAQAAEPYAADPGMVLNSARFRGK